MGAGDHLVDYEGNFGKSFSAPSAEFRNLFDLPALTVLVASPQIPGEHQGPSPSWMHDVGGRELKGF